MLYKDIKVYNGKIPTRCEETILLCRLITGPNVALPGATATCWQVIISTYLPTYVNVILC